MSLCPFTFGVEGPRDSSVELDSIERQPGSSPVRILQVRKSAGNSGYFKTIKADKKMQQKKPH